MAYQLRHGGAALGSLRAGGFEGEGDIAAAAAATGAAGAGGRGLLELLVGRSGEPFSRGEILKDVWGYTPERHVDTRVVDVHISRLRSKLEDDPANPELILTARGTGYLFQRIIDSVAPEGS